MTGDAPSQDITPYPKRWLPRPRRGRQQTMPPGYSMTIDAQTGRHHWTAGDTVSIGYAHGYECFHAAWADHDAKLEAQREVLRQKLGVRKIVPFSKKAAGQ